VKGSVALPDLADRRPPPAGAAVTGKPGARSERPERPAGRATADLGTGNGQTIDLTSGQLPQRGPNDPPPGTPSVPPPSNNVPPPTPPPGSN
jgi:hypothetical protein